MKKWTSLLPTTGWMVLHITGMLNAKGTRLPFHPQVRVFDDWLVYLSTSPLSAPPIKLLHFLTHMYPSLALCQMLGMPQFTRRIRPLSSRSLGAMGWIQSR